MNAIDELVEYYFEEPEFPKEKEKIKAFKKRLNNLILSSQTKAVIEARNEGVEFVLQFLADDPKNKFMIKQIRQMSKEKGKYIYSPQIKKKIWLPELSSSLGGK